MFDRRLWLLLPALLAGCSVINSFDDLKKQGTGTGGVSNTGGGNPGGSSGTGGGGGTSGSGGGGAGGTSNVHPAPTKGLVVLGGTDSTKAGLISVLNPGPGPVGDGATGSGGELKREMLASGAQVAGIAYDGAAGRDDWYIFVATTFPAAKDQVVDLEVRYFDDKTSAWSQISKTTTLPPPKPDSFAVLNDRLAYLSYTIVSGTPVASLTLLDTSDLTNIQQITVPPLTALPSDAQLVGLLGARGGVGDPTAVGGQLTVIYTTGCASGVCQLQALPITVGASVVPSVVKTIDTFAGTPAFASALITPRNYYALPQPGTTVKFVSNDPRSPDVLSTFASPSSASDLGSLTIAECSGAAAFTSASESALFAVTLSVNLGSSRPLGFPGQLVRWDPFSAAVASGTSKSGLLIATFNPNLASAATMPDGAPWAPVIQGYTVTSNGTTQVSLVRHVNWGAPKDIYTDVMEVRFPVGFACP